MKESGRDRSSHFPSELNPQKANPEKVNEVVPKNFVLNVLNGTATKLAEQLASPGLILPWLLVTLNAPTALTGLLVPVRQAGALLPQLVVSGQIRRFPVRKWLWVSGGTTQALALLIMAAAAAAFSSLLAGLVIVGALALFSVARGVCSVTFQDLTGKTIPKGRRGRLLSTRAAAGGSLALIAGLIVRHYIHEGSDVGPYIVLILSAAVLWVLASIFFVGIEEEPETSEQGRNPIQEIREGLSAVRTVPWFRQFLLTRCFLLSLELAVPFFALHAREIIPDASGALGTYMISLALASVLSSPFWGRFADISSRKVMMRAAGMGSIAGLFALSMGGLPGEWRSPFLYGLVFVLIGFAREGTVLGRKTYIVDGTPRGALPLYVAFSNTVMGIVFLVGALFGIVAQVFGIDTVIGILVVLSLVGMMTARNMPEAQAVLRGHEP